MVGTPNGFLVLIFSSMTTTWWNIHPVNFILMIPGKAVTRLNANDIKAHSIPRYNHTIQKQSNIKNIPAGKEKILQQPSTATELFILFQMKQMVSIIFIHSITERKKILPNSILRSGLRR